MILAYADSPLMPADTVMWCVGQIVQLARDDREDVGTGNVADVMQSGEFMHVIHTSSLGEHSPPDTQHLLLRILKSRPPQKFVFDIRYVANIS